MFAKVSGPKSASVCLDSRRAGTLAALQSVVRLAMGNVLARSSWSLLLLVLITPFVQAESSERPNIIYILLDDAGYGDLSCYGQSRFKTPHIDQLALEGMRFTQHYSGSTVCAPTRCCLMTGLHTGHAVVRGNREVKPEGQAEMPADTVTIPRLLKKAGYVTGCFGKWGLGAPGSASDPSRHFDVFFGYNCQRQAHNYYPTHLWHNQLKIGMDGETHSAPVIHQAGMDFIRKHHDKPFFVYFSVTIPHAAMHAPESYVAPFRKKFPQFEKTIGKYQGPEVRNPVAAFAGMMTLMDEEIGEVMTLLKELGIDDNTLVMLSSDNGPHKEGGHRPDFFDSNGPLRGYKRDLYEGGIRAPLIARWPGKIAPNTESTLVSAHWDMLPTFCELAGVEPTTKTDGISITDELTGNAARQRRHEYLYWEFYERSGSRAVRFGDWKAVQNHLNQNPDAPVEVYSLKDDIGEQHDLAAEQPEIVAKAKAFMKSAHTPSPFWKFGKPKPKQKPARKGRATQSAT